MSSEYSRRQTHTHTETFLRFFIAPERFHCNESISILYIFKTLLVNYHCPPPHMFAIIVLKIVGEQKKKKTRFRLDISFSKSAWQIILMTVIHVSFLPCVRLAFSLFIPDEGTARRKNLEKMLISLLGSMCSCLCGVWWIIIYFYLVSYLSNRIKNEQKIPQKKTWSQFRLGSFR